VVFEILTDFFVNDPSTNEPFVSAIINFTHDVKTTIRSTGYYGVFGLMLLEASSLPIPSEVILPFAGFLISTGEYQFDFVLMVLVSTLAALVGSFIDYYIGLKGYQAITKYRLFGRSLCSESQLKTATDWFTRYGTVMVFVARLVPVFRTIISFPAGAIRMPLAKFAGYTIAGCVIWNTLLIYVGYYLGNNWAEVTDIAHYLVIAAVIAFATLATYLLIRRKRRIAACQKSQKG
ncbi:MAG: DedA family protein, partial [Betaproteobacteria bacterium]